MSVYVVRLRSCKLFDQLSLIARHLFRRLHLDRREEIAAPASADVRHPFPFQPQGRSGRRALGHSHGLGTIERRHLDITAERDRREVDRNLAEQVHAVPPEELVVLHVNDDVEMAGRSAGGSRFPFALETELLASGDPGRNLHRDLALLRDASGAVARGARLGDDLAGAAALRAGARDGEEALLEPYLTLPTALRT